MEREMGLWRRLVLAMVAYFAVLFDRAFAQSVARLREGAPARAKPDLPGKTDRRDALHVLAVLQRDGRLIDFLKEDIASFSDAEVGAAARAVHEGCKKTLSAYLTLEPICGDPEGASVVVEAGFDPAAFRLTGNVVGNPPFKGSLKHHGWRVSEVKLPAPPEGQDGTILAPAEVELT
jgi:hypothetical protein